MRAIKTLDCFVPGVPCTKGSWKIVGRTKHRLIPDNRGEKLWAESVGWAAKAQRPDLVRKPRAVDVYLLFRLPKPERAKNQFPTQDVDKLARSVLDALTGIAYEDDVQVIWLRASKEYAIVPSDVGVQISVMTSQEPCG